MGKQFQFMSKYWNISGTLLNADRSEAAVAFWVEIEAPDADGDASKRPKNVRDRRNHKNKPH